MEKVFKWNRQDENLSITYQSCLRFWTLKLKEMSFTHDVILEAGNWFKFKILALAQNIFQISHGKLCILSEVFTMQPPFLFLLKKQKKYINFKK